MPGGSGREHRRYQCFFVQPSRLVTSSNILCDSATTLWFKGANLTRFFAVTVRNSNPWKARERLFTQDYAVHAVLRSKLREVLSA